MSNMSYCRFQNTTKDFQDCLDALNEMYLNPNEDNVLSQNELAAAKQLVGQTVKMMKLLSEILQEEDFTVFVEQETVETAIDNLQQSCEDDDDQ